MAREARTVAEVSTRQFEHLADASCDGSGGPLNSWLNEGNQRALEALRRNREWGIEAAAQWFFDQDTALLPFTFPERVIVTPLQFLGSHNAKTGTWMWAWANDSIDPRLKADSMALREVGEQLGHPIFTERILNVSEEDAAAWPFSLWSEAGMTAVVLAVRLTRLG